MVGAEKVVVNETTKPAVASETKIGPSGKMVFDWGKFEGHPVQLVIDERGDVQFEILYTDFAPTYDEAALNFMKSEVERIAGSPNGVHVSHGLSVRISGYPTWGPHGEFGPNREAYCLHFARGVMADNLSVVVQGKMEVPEGYYPYNLPTRSTRWR